MIKLNNDLKVVEISGEDLKPVLFAFEFCRKYNFNNFSQSWGILRNALEDAGNNGRVVMESPKFITEDEYNWIVFSLMIEGGHLYDEIEKKEAKK